MTRDELIRVAASIRTDTNLSALALSSMRGFMDDLEDHRLHDQDAKNAVDAAVQSLIAAAEQLTSAVKNMGGRA